MNATIEDRLRSYAATLDQAADAKQNPSPTLDQNVLDQRVIETLPAPLPLCPRRDRRLTSQSESAVLVVWSDLMSRYAAMCVSVGPYQQPDVTSQLHGCFTNGAVAAARFPADMTKAKAVAAANPPVTPVAPDSHAAGEVAVQVNAIVESDVGCGGNGGFIFTTLEPVVWQRIGTGVTATDGTIGHTPFIAHYDPTTGWFARLLVC